MHIHKPVWVSHDGKPIFSVHIHPNGKRFATGGQGKDSGRIVVWSMLPIQNEKSEIDKNVPKLLCQMDNHVGCVNIVRWSNHGNWLASGGDDKIVMIWKLTGEGPSTVFGSGSGSSATVNHESWRCFVTLTAHSGDVLDLAWSPSDRYLATCSVDNSIIVWGTSNKFSERVAVINEHTGLVKGVSWDPIGKYLASQSDDRSLRIWSTADWTQQAKITRPFEECSGTTHVLRNSWSPDGQCLVSAHAMNGGGPTAQIIERDGWKHDKDFVGHRKAVTCVSFNPNIFKNTKTKRKSQPFTCCVTGSRDRKISLWSTTDKRPLIVLHDIFTSSVLDLSWSSCGYQLFACSWDGTVAYLEFEGNEIGVPLSLEDKNVLYEKMYGKAPSEDPFLNSCNNRIIESAEVLKIIENERSKVENGVKRKSEFQTNFEKRSTLIEQQSKPLNHQSEPDSQLKKPKKPPLQSHSDQGTTIAAVNGFCTNSSNSNLSMAKDDLPNFKKQQVEVRLPNGKRRITPLSLSTEHPEYNEKFRSQSPVAQINSCVEVRNHQHPQTDSYQLNQNETKKVVLHESPKTLQTVPKNYSQPIVGLQITDVMCKDVPEDEVIQEYVHIPDSSSQLISPLTKITKFHKIIVFNDIERLPSSIIQGVISKVEVQDKSSGKSLWDAYFGSPISLLNSNHKNLVIACKDQNLHIFSLETAARQFPPIFLEDQTAFLVLSEADNNLCLVLTTSGLMHMWNLSTGESLLNRMSLRMFVTKTVNITNCQLTSNGYPLIFLNDNRVYMFNMRMKTWHLLANPKDPISKIGCNQTILKNPTSQLSLNNCIPSLLNLHQPLRLQANSSNQLEKLPSGIVRSFLECQLASSSLLQSPEEFKYWMLVLVKHLLDKGPEYRLRSILDDLLGSTVPQIEVPDQELLMVGIRKKDLLKEILSIIGSHLPWQRLYNEYNEQLNQMI